MRLNEVNLAWVVTLVAIIAVVSAVSLGFKYDSERAKRIGLEAENREITSIMDRVAKASIGAQHTMADCYSYQGEISFLLADYYKYYQTNSRDSGVVPDTGQ